jgi:hypothetical protein
MGGRLDVWERSGDSRGHRPVSSSPLHRQPAEHSSRSLLHLSGDDNAFDRPDGIDGIHCKWLRDVHGIDTDALPTYLHVYEDGRRVWPKAYPDKLWADFRKHFREEWLPHHSIEYFRKRDSEALQFLPKLIAANKPKKLN